MMPDRMILYDAKGNASVPVSLLNDLEHLSEEAECAHMVLDDMGVPREEGARTYSLVGRIRWALENRPITRVDRGGVAGG